MEISRLMEILDSFLKDDNKSTILIDGDWGVGKTYAVLKYFENESNKYEALYASFFGKENIEDIKKELYVQKYKFQNFMKGSANFLLTLISATTSLNETSSINLNGESFRLRQDFSKKQLKKLAKESKKKTIIILDDLERLNKKRISLDLATGLINYFSMNGLKTICIANISKISSYQDKEEFKEYDLKKLQHFEKTFDRIYKFNKSNIETVRELLKNEFDDMISKKTISEHFINLRLVKKGYELYNEIRFKKGELFNSFDQELKEKVLISCIALVSNFFSNDIENKIEELLDKPKHLKDTSEDVGLNNFFQNLNMFKDEGKYKNFAKIIPGIDKNNKNEVLLLEAIDKIIIEEDYSLFENIYNKRNHSVLSESLFYLSDDEKKSKYNEQKEYIANLKKDVLNQDKDALKSLVFRSIADWINNEVLDVSSFNESFWINLVQINLDLLEGFHFGESKSKIIADFNNAIEKYRLKYHIEQIKELLINEKWEDLIDKIKFTGDFKECDIKEILDDFINHDFYFPKISESISPENWNRAHNITWVVSEIAKKDSTKTIQNEFVKYLNNLLYENPEDNSLKDRVNSLKKQYNIV